MNVPTALAPLSALLGVACAVAIGCGEESRLLRQADAAGLKSELQQVRDAVDARDCDAAGNALQTLQRRVRTLRPPVARDLRRQLRVEIDEKLAPAVTTDCAADRTETLQTTTEVTPPPTTEPETTPAPTTPPTGTDTTVPPPTEPPATEPTTPPVETIPPADPGVDPGGFGGEGTG